MQTAQQLQLAEIGKAYFTATIWVSKGRFTYCTDDKKSSGHCAEPNERKLRRCLWLEVFCLRAKGYEVHIKNATIEG